MENLSKKLEKNPITASAPCRIDMGGTIDIPVFHYPLNYLSPCTFNIALDIRTRISLLPFERKRIKISSEGPEASENFKPAEFLLDEAPFNHRFGLISAIASYFRADGVHIKIKSASPLRSALGGSSTAAVALIKAFSKAFEQPVSKEQNVILAHTIESNVAGVPCGLQDQLAAVYGGVHAWHWTALPDKIGFKREIIKSKCDFKELQEHLILAYCGIPHESKNINGKWVEQFLLGKKRKEWVQIIKHTHDFAAAIKSNNWKDAAAAMNREVSIRRDLTPDVLDNVGIKLVDSAINAKCGARFTGAGGGGCLWAVGEKDDIKKLKKDWKVILNKYKNARLLNMKIAESGVGAKAQIIQKRT
ncbi:D-glycero-alpha-D-manno-heptose-7-phosphate kinase [Candidatus Magnetomoraceae bacterium gMMP-15]